MKYASSKFQKVRDAIQLLRMSETFSNLCYEIDDDCNFPQKIIFEVEFDDMIDGDVLLCDFEGTKTPIILLNSYFFDMNTIEIFLHIENFLKETYGHLLI